MLACDAGVVPIVMNGAGQPLDVGRIKRTIPDGLRRAVTARDRGCAHPGCGRPPSWCEIHHVTPWEQGGTPNSATSSCSAASTTASSTAPMDHQIPRRHTRVHPSEVDRRRTTPQTTSTSPSRRSVRRRVRTRSLLRSGGGRCMSTARQSRRPPDRAVETARKVACRAVRPRPALGEARRHGRRAGDAGQRRRHGATTLWSRAGARRADRGAARPPGLLALQRSAGNAAVSALLAGRMRSPGARGGRRHRRGAAEVRRDEPVVETVEKGLQAAKAAGVPVDLDGAAQKPPASALAVVRTGFGPESVPAKKPVPPPKPVPTVSPLGKAAAKPGEARRWATGAAPARGRRPAPLRRPPRAGAAIRPGRRAGRVVGDQLLAPPVPPPGVRPADDPAFTQVTGAVKGVAKAKRAHPPAASKAKEAQDAALAPADDLAGQAKAAKVDTMDAQQPGSFDKKAFIAAVKTAIEAKSPEDAQGGRRLQEVRQGRRGQGRGQGPGDAAGRTARPATSRRRPTRRRTSRRRSPKPVTPMAPEQPGAGPGGRGRGRGAQAGAARAAQPRRRHRTRPTRRWPRARSPSSSWRSRTSRSSSRRWPTSRPPPRTRRPRPREFRQQEQQVITQHKADASAQTAAGVAGMQSQQGRRAGHAGRREGQDQDQGRGQAGRGHHEDPGDLRRDREGREGDPRRARPQGRRGVHRGRGRGAAGVRDLRRREDARLQEGPLRRLAGRAALGQGQAARDARQGQRVLRGRPRALPQADGQGHHPASPTSSATT